jgi:hypothetical protein
VKSQRAYVGHVIDRIRRIAEDSAPGRDAVFASRTLQDAIVRNLQVLRLIVTRDLPPLESAMRAILAVLDEPR